jgi:nucleotide-binding universal stress UspA family protein
MILTKGNPAEAIIEKAKDMQDDLVVLAAIRVNGINQLFLGSVSRKVVRHVPCLVLVLRRKLNNRRE